MESWVDVEIRENIRVLKLRRPPVNALDVAICDQISSRLEELAADAAVGGIVLTGGGKCFSAGVDLRTVTRYGAQEQSAMLAALNRLFLTAYSLPAPLIGAINGHAIAGGLVLALACDYRVGPASVGEFGLTEVRVGVPYPVAAMEVVRSELGPGVLRNLVMRGRNGGPKEALRWGVFDELQPPDRIIGRALAVADEQALLPRAGFVKVKYQLRRDAISRSQAALAGAEPLNGNWLSEETLSAAAGVLARKSA